MIKISPRLPMGRFAFPFKRDTDLSDRDVGYPTLEQRIDDMRAVVAAAGSITQLLGQWARSWLKNSLVRSFCGVEKKALGGATSTI